MAIDNIARGMASEALKNSGSSDYDSLSNKPSINDVTLDGNKTAEELNLQPAGDYVIDPNYVHTDNNYSDEEKNKVTDVIEDVTSDRNILVEPTGFTNNENITVTYDSATRKVTLNGSFQAYYKGILVDVLTDGWQSPAHVNVSGNYFLRYDGTNFIFDNTPWTFDTLHIAYVQYGTTNLGIKETHGLMQWQSHKEFHETIGTYKLAGGDFTGFTLNSTTASNRRPDIGATTVMDEDLRHVINPLTSKLYTQRYLTGSAIRTFTTDASDIIPLLGNNPYYNQNVGGTWQQTLMNNTEYGAIFIVAIPVTSDTNSQKYRYAFVQPQQVSSTLSVIQALTPNNLVLGDPQALVSEFVFIGRIIIRYIGGNWEIVEVTSLTGNRYNQTGSPAGNYLTTVFTTGSLTGSGTSTDPLNANISTQVEAEAGTDNIKLMTPLRTKQLIDIVVGDINDILEARLNGN